ncbi:MAG: PIN domain-containing protein [Spirochaetes bacterium]|nr:PIN domain-containing protein [Spirochaetota bacterium]
MILLESSAFIENLRFNGRGDIKARVKSALLSSQAVLCEPVLLELWAGCRAGKERQALEVFEETLPILECDATVWSLARQNAKLFRAKGQTFSNFDILIFSLALRHEAGIIAVDKAYAKMRNILRKELGLSG